MKNLKRVLCAVDIDDADRHVFAYALALARRSGASLLIVHAASPVTALNVGATRRVDFLRKLRVTAEGAGVDVRVTVQRGDVAGVILLHATARHPDLVVLGAGRRRHQGRFGSVAERVVREASCRTLVIPPTADPAASFGSVVCAVDFSPASEAAVHEALRLRKQIDRGLTLLHVVDGPAPEDPSHYPWQATQEYDRGIAADALERLQKLIPPLDRGRVLSRVAVGSPVDEILRTARAVDAELLIIGARRRNRVAGGLFGQTGLLLRRAIYPVLAVPQSAHVRTGQPERGNVAA